MRAHYIRLAYDWPGKVRELLYTLKRAAVQGRTGEIDGDTLERCLLKLTGNQRTSASRAAMKPKNPVRPFG